MQSDAWYWQKTWGSFRHGTRRITMAWDGGLAEINMFDKGVPLTSAAFLAKLPLQLEVVHVAWSGDMIMGSRPVPLGVSAQENLTRLVLPGDIAYDPKYDEVTVTYGSAEAKLPSGDNTLTVMGSISSGLDEFARWARARRFEGVGVLRFSVADSL